MPRGAVSPARFFLPPGPNLLFAAQIPMIVPDMIEVTAPAITKYPRPRGNLNFTKAVLLVMAGQVFKCRGDGDLKALAGRLEAPGFPVATVGRDFRYLKGRIPYKDDPRGIEWIASARRTVLYGEGGDCDDLSVASATVLMMQGIPCFFRAIAYRVPEFTHVYTVARVGKREIPFDLTLDRVGQERIFKRNIDLELQ